jgi:hypothetical protein
MQLPRVLLVVVTLYYVVCTALFFTVVESNPTSNPSSNPGMGGVATL